MYITCEQYEQITGHDPYEATDARIKRSSRLLDARIGNHPRGDWKLDMDSLESFQQDAVKEWVSWMVFSLVENGDSVQVNETVRLGRFSATAREQADEYMPDELIYADQQLKDSGLIRRGVKYTNSPTDSTVINV